MRKYFLKPLLVILLGVFPLFSIALAQEQKPKFLQGIEVLAGYGWADLKTQKDYQLYPVIVDLDFNFKKLVQKIGINPWMLIQFQLEPYIAGVSKPDANVEVGNAFAFKIGILPDTFAIQPYIKAAAGMLYMSQHTYEQGTQFNFYEYGAGGIHWFFNKNTALTVEYRFRHLSNLSIKEPNGGINTSFIVAGISYQF